MQVAFFGNSAAASSRIVPAAAAFSARISFSFSSSSSSATSLSSFKCLRSSPFVSRLFLNQRRSPSPCFSERGLSAAATRICVASDPGQLKSGGENFMELFRTTCYPILLNFQLKRAREDIKELLKTMFCYPILVRLGWHDAGTYNKNIQEWPQRGGANGSLRFEIGLKHGSNAGLALKLLQPIKDKYSGVTYADLFQLASATAVEESGGPKIPMKYGRVDVTRPTYFPKGRLPAAGLRSPADRLRDVFYRMGLSDKEIVALSGAHKLGRSRPEPSGWGKPETKYTKSGPGAPGGQSWTVQWLKFDNSYFKDIKERRDKDLLVLPTDAVLIEDPSFKVYAEKYAEDQETFFKDYAEAHAKFSNLGAKFDPPEGIVIG